MGDEERKESKADGDVKAKKEKKKKEKKEKPVVKIDVKNSKANSRANIDPRTGTRFEPGSARQLAFDVVYKGVKAGKNAKAIRMDLLQCRKDKGSKWNLDVGYLNFVVACHPDMFEAYSDGTVKLLKEPQPDPEAARKLEEERKAKRARAEKAREERRAKAKGEKKDKKKEKKEKKED